MTTPDPDFTDPRVTVPRLAAIAAQLNWHPLTEVTLPRCAHAGCRDPVDAYYLPAPIKAGPAAFYCNDHAHEGGWCHGCGDFCAGQDDFEMNPTGLCGTCQADADAEEWDEWSDGDEDDEEPYYYDEGKNY